MGHFILAQNQDKDEIMTRAIRVCSLPALRIRELFQKPRLIPESPRNARAVGRRQPGQKVKRRRVQPIQLRIQVS